MKNNVASNGIGWHIEVLTKSGWQGCSRVVATKAEAKQDLDACRAEWPDDEFRVYEALAGREAA